MLNDIPNGRESPETPVPPPPFPLPPSLVEPLSLDPERGVDDELRAFERSVANRQIVIGFVLIAIGIGLTGTWGSLRVIAYGPILAGAAQLLRGLSRR